MTPEDKQQIKLDDISTYSGFMDALRKFSKNLAKQSLYMDEQVRNFMMVASQKEDIVVSTIESFVYTILKTREAVLKADERGRTESLIKEALNKQLDELENMAEVMNDDVNPVYGVPLSAINEMRKEI